MNRVSHRRRFENAPPPLPPVDHDDLTVVDVAMLHGLDGFFRAQTKSDHVDVHHVTPLLHVAVYEENDPKNRSTRAMITGRPLRVVTQNARHIAQARVIDADVDTTQGSVDPRKHGRDFFFFR